jgi:hypothetical protein
LEGFASKFWPAELSEAEAKVSIIPLLVQTQDQFIAVIGAGAKSVEDLFTIVEVSTLPANLFLKHLSVLADFGGEMFQRVSREFKTLFPNGSLKFVWQDKQHIYQFQALPHSRLSNQKLKIDGKEVLKDHPLNNLQKDAIVLLLFGSASSEPTESVASALSKCEIGDYLGKPAELKQYVKQRYIWVSRITGGAKSNTLGQAAQKFVADYIRDTLGMPHARVYLGGKLPGVTHTDPITGRLTSFDIVVANAHKRVAIEVSFQVTTNSVIERKAGQAKARYEQVEKTGHKIAYVLDGAGNFQRDTALKTICEHSHCTVAFSRNELDVLCRFLREELAQKK